MTMIWLAYSMTTKSVLASSALERRAKANHNLSETGQRRRERRERGLPICAEKHCFGMIGELIASGKNESGQARAALRIEIKRTLRSPSKPSSVPQQKNQTQKENDDPHEARAERLLELETRGGAMA